MNNFFRTGQNPCKNLVLKNRLPKCQYYDSSKSLQLNSLESPNVSLMKKYSFWKFLIKIQGLSYLHLSSIKTKKFQKRFKNGVYFLGAAKFWRFLAATNIHEHHCYTRVSITIWGFHYFLVKRLEKVRGF